jgi:8-oxo-dGTP pyrophosphatase MutT (NUDIX family)
MSQSNRFYNNNSFHVLIDNVSDSESESDSYDSDEETESEIINFNSDRPIKECQQNVSESTSLNLQNAIKVKQVKQEKLQNAISIANNFNDSKKENYESSKLETAINIANNLEVSKKENYESSKLETAINIANNLEVSKKENYEKNNLELSKKKVNKSNNERIFDCFNNFKYIISNDMIDESKKSKFVDYLNMMLIVSITSKKVPDDFKDKMNKLLNDLMKENKKKFEWLFTKNMKFTLTEIPLSEYAIYDNLKKNHKYSKGAGIILYKFTKERVLDKIDFHNIEIFMVQSNSNCWGFPKGKLEEGENLKTCALREFYEETGYYLDNSLINDKTKYVIATDRKNGIVVKSIRYFIIEVEQDFKIDSFPGEVNNETTGMAWFKDNEIIFSIEKSNPNAINCQIDKYPFTNRKIKKEKKSYCNLSKTTNDVINEFNDIRRKSDSSVYNLSKSELRELNKKSYLSSQSKYVLIEFYNILLKRYLYYGLKRKIQQKLNESKPKYYKKFK